MILMKVWLRTTNVNISPVVLLWNSFQRDTESFKKIVERIRDILNLTELYLFILKMSHYFVSEIDSYQPTLLRNTFHLSNVKYT